MLASTFRMCSNGTSREIRRRNVLELLRHISKTSSVPNSDNMTSPRHENKDDMNYKRERWTILRKHNNHRALSTVNANAISKQIAMVSKDESREFMSVFPDLVRDLTEAQRHSDIPEVTKRLIKVLQYNVPSGKKLRGLALVSTYKMLESPENLTPENVRLANILGWCVEMLQTTFLIYDDIVDNSETRRGVPCWYRYQDTGMQAINDGLLLYSCIFAILRQNCINHPSYQKIVDLFNEVTLLTCMGQALDTNCIIDGKPNIDSFTMDKYRSIVKYKTSFYTFYLPIALAMHLSGQHDPELHRQAKTILLEMGEFFQIQDDFLDTFGNSEITGKKGTDIMDGKCSWLIVVALQRVNAAQKEILREHYGRQNAESEQIVRNLYEELGLPNTYAVYEEECFNIIRTHIQQISKGLPHKLFFKFLEKVYRRES